MNCYQDSSRGDALIDAGWGRTYPFSATDYVQQFFTRAPLFQRLCNVVSPPGVSILVHKSWYDLYSHANPISNLALTLEWTDILGPPTPSASAIAGTDP